MRQRGRSPGRPLYLQVADDIRAAIRDSTLLPGQLLPPERALAERYDVSLVAVRAGLGVLRAEGLIVTEPGQGSRVRRAPETVVVMIPPGATIRCRMPTPDERETIGIPEGVPVFEVHRNGEMELLPGDQFTLETIADAPE